MKIKIFPTGRIFEFAMLHTVRSHHDDLVMLAIEWTESTVETRKMSGLRTRAYGHSISWHYETIRNDRSAIR